MTISESQKSILEFQNGISSLQYNAFRNFPVLQVFLKIGGLRESLFSLGNIIQNAISEFRNALLGFQNGHLG